MGQTRPVLILGGGIAGLAALHELRAAGISVQLLESRWRAGGRVWSGPGGTATDPPVELGAEFVHGRPPEMMQLLAEAGIRTVPVVFNRWRQIGGQLLPESERPDEGALLSKLPRAGRDVNFREYLAQSPSAGQPTGDWALDFVEGFHAADPARLSTLALADENEAEARLEGEWQARLPAGYSQLVDWLSARHASGLQLGQEVRRVEWQPGVVRVQTVASPRVFGSAQVFPPPPSEDDGAGRGGTTVWEGDAAIITFPLSVLQRAARGEGVSFVPPLREKLPALDTLAMGGARRLTLQFDAPVWEWARDAHGDPLGEGFLFRHAAQSGHFPTWWMAPAGQRWRMTGWAAGRHAWALAGISSERLLHTALDDLGALLQQAPQRLWRRLQAAWSHDWQNDRTTLGGYSYATVGGREAHRELAAPLAQTLYFAGEACEGAGYRATVAGALRSGRSAAAQLLRDRNARSTRSLAAFQESQRDH